MNTATHDLAICFDFCLWSRCFPNLLDGVDRGEGDLEGPGFEALMTQHTALDGLFR